MIKEESIKQKIKRWIIYKLDGIIASDYSAKVQTMIIKDQADRNRDKETYDLLNQDD